MSSEECLKQLADVSAFISRGITPAYVEAGGVSVINQKCIRNGSVDLNQARKTDPAKKRIPSDKFLKEFDILVNSTGVGTLGRVGQIFGKFGEITVDSHITIVRPDPNKVDPTYLGYVLKNLQPNIEALAEGSTGQTELSRHKLGELSFLELDITEQKAVGSLCKSLDDRIALLRETNATLEAIAHAIFKSWFVNFDPVHAKAEGKKPEGIDAATAALFSDSFEKTELGMVPKGWNISTVGDVIETVGGATPDTKNGDYWHPPIHNWTTPKDLSGLTDSVLLDTERSISPKGLEKISSGLLPAGTLLMSSRAPIGYLAISNISIAINQGYIAMLPGGVLPPSYMLYWCRINMEAIKSRANGSTFMEISKKSFRPIPIVVPSKELVNHFCTIVDAIFARITLNAKSSSNLAEIRDSLLPKLISGRLRITDEEIKVA